MFGFFLEGWKAALDSEVKSILGIELPVVQYDELGAEQGG